VTAEADPARDDSPGGPGSAATGRSRWAIAIRVIVVAAVIAGLALIVRDTDLAALGARLAQADPALVAIAVVVNFGIIAGRAFAWNVLLAPTHRVGAVPVFRYTLIAYAASIVMPLRMGELIRLWLLRDRHAVPVAHGAAIAIAEKLLDVVSLAVVVAPLPLYYGEMPPALVRALVIAAAATLVAAVAIYGLAPRLPRTGWVGELARGLSVVRQPRPVAIAFVALLAAWAIDLAVIELAAAAVGLALPVGAAVVVLAATNLALSVPSTPGQIGAFELGAIAGLRLVGRGDDAGIAFAVVYHAIQAVPVMAVGLVLGAKEMWRRRRAGA
jgi:uncharacterized membrane protein YbhN (UPF0104 family)